MTPLPLNLGCLEEQQPRSRGCLREEVRSKASGSEETQWGLLQNEQSKQNEGAIDPPWEEKREKSTGGREEKEPKDHPQRWEGFSQERR